MLAAQGREESCRRQRGRLVVQGAEHDGAQRRFAAQRAAVARHRQRPEPFGGALTAAQPQRKRHARAERAFEHDDRGIGGGCELGPHRHALQPARIGFDQ